jgi:hypothetical protein
MFVSKVGAYQRIAPFRVYSWAYSQTIEKAGKACQGKHSSLLQTFINHRCRNFIAFGPKLIMPKVSAKVFCKMGLQLWPPEHHHRPYDVRSSSTSVRNRGRRSVGVVEIVRSVGNVSRRNVEKLFKSRRRRKYSTRRIWLRRSDFVLGRKPDFTVHFRNLSNNKEP